MFFADLVNFWKHICNFVILPENYVVNFLPLLIFHSFLVLLVLRCFIDVMSLDLEVGSIFLTIFWHFQKCLSIQGSNVPLIKIEKGPLESCVFSIQKWYRNRYEMSSLNSHWKKWQDLKDQNTSFLRKITSEKRKETDDPRIGWIQCCVTCWPDGCDKAT